MRDFGKLHGNLPVYADLKSQNLSAAAALNVELHRLARPPVCNTPPKVVGDRLAVNLYEKIIGP